VRDLSSEGVLLLVLLIGQARPLQLLQVLQVLQVPLKHHALLLPML
jgi:hypothetical protein